MHMEFPFFVPTDLYPTQQTPKPRSRGNNPSHPTLSHHPTSRFTMVPRLLPQKPLGLVNHDAETAATPVTSG
jgi:hypothetical protein